MRLAEAEEVPGEQAEGAGGAQRVPALARHRQRRHTALLLRRPAQHHKCMTYSSVVLL